MTRVRRLMVAAVPTELIVLWIAVVMVWSIVNLPMTLWYMGVPPEWLAGLWR